MQAMEQRDVSALLNRVHLLAALVLTLAPPSTAGAHDEQATKLHHGETAWGHVVMTASGLTLNVDRPPEDGVLAIPRLNNPITAVYLQKEATKEPLTLSPG